MTLDKPLPLFFPFFLALAATLYMTAFFPHTHLHTFAPFLALLYSRCSRLSSLWISSLCGLIIDLLCSELRFGVYALSFGIATIALYNQKKHFYQDKPLALSLFTLQISVITTSMLFLFTFLSQRSFHLTLKWFIGDFFLMSICDALYAFLWFSCPMMLYTYLRRMQPRRLVLKVFSSLKKTNADS